MRAPCWLEMDHPKSGDVHVRVRLDTFRRRLAFAWFCAGNVSPWWLRPWFVLVVLSRPLWWSA